MLFRSPNKDTQQWLRKVVRHPPSLGIYLLLLPRDAQHENCLRQWLRKVVRHPPTLGIYLLLLPRDAQHKNCLRQWLRKVVRHPPTSWVPPYYIAYPRGIEPPSAEPESAVLSVKLWVQSATCICYNFVTQVVS